jgi:hypothetical protein
MKSPLSSPIVNFFRTLLPVHLARTPHVELKQLWSSLAHVLWVPSFLATLTLPGEAESGSAGTQPDKEYPGEGVPMVRRPLAASSCQGPLCCAPSAALFIPQKIRPCSLEEAPRGVRSGAPSS